MKLKRILAVALVALFGFVVVGCGKNDTPTDNPTNVPTETPTDTAPTGKLVVWVGSESTAFYQEKLNAYASEKKLPFTFDVQGVDTGAAAATFLTDPEAGADIFTIAHDNFGKLLDGSGVIAPVTKKALVDQMENNTSLAFLNACYLQAGDGSEPQYYGVPAISQALVLYYNKSAFAGQEEKLKTWEGIMEVAKAKGSNVLATSFMGTDGYNFSNFLLAQPKSDDAIAAFGSQGTLKIYQNTIQANCFNWGDDQIAIMKYAQRFVCDPNGRGGLLTSNGGYAPELSAGTTLTLIGGSWAKGTVISSLGADNWGVVELPSFTLTEADAYGTAKAGMEFYNGTFADCKCFVKKKGSKFAAYLDDILLYLTSNEMQRESFVKCDNLPASSNVDCTITAADLKANANKDDKRTDAEFERDAALNSALANAQVASGKHGIAQPFGFKTKYNSYYYSAGAPDLYVAIVQNTDNKYSTDAAIKETLQTASYIWAKGKNPDTTTAAGLELWNSWIAKTE